MKSITSLMSIIIIFSCMCSLSDQHNPKDCMHECGNISVPYPFGIGPAHCSRHTYFDVSCNSSSKSQTPFLKKFNLEIVHVRKSDNDIVVKIPTVTTCSSTEIHGFSPKFGESSFYIDPTKNVFVSVGCHGYAIVFSTNNYTSGCTSVCAAHTPNPHSRFSLTHALDQCYGFNNCCRMSSYRGPWVYDYTLIVSANNESSGNYCRSAFLISLEYMATVASTPQMSVPVTLTWSSDEDDPLVLLELASIVGSIVFALSCVTLCWWCKTKKRRKEIRLRKRYFKGKLKEKRFFNQEEEEVEKTKLFTYQELKKATNNFNENLIIGKGGQGTVYKGILNDGRLIAIKKSFSMSESQWKEFINEVIILSHVNHRYVVKLFGCCLETKYPFVVYEFIPNGTLYELIHNPSDEFVATWEIRLKIASEVAGAIAYLHSTSSTPILHRDIKSMNVLLDHKYTAKVCDFGISRNTTIDQTHLTTLVKGTFGYFDPQYFRSNQFTEKSDVYSFGVVLFEILTGQTPICQMPDDVVARSVVMEFASISDHAALYAMLDPIIRSGYNKIEDIMTVVNLAKCCLHPEGADRPTMMEVSLELMRLSQKTLVEEPSSSKEKTIQI